MTKTGARIRGDLESRRSRIPNVLPGMLSATAKEPPASAEVKRNSPSIGFVMTVGTKREA